MKRMTKAIAVAAMAVPLIAASLQAASAKPAPGPKAVPEGKTASNQSHSSKDAGVSPLELRGIQVVTSDAIVDGAGTQTSGRAVCPGNTKVIGGGTVIAGFSLSENINGSIPLTDGKTWQVYINNSSGTAGSFRVYAVCAKKAANYSVQSSGGTTNPAGSQTRDSVACPTGSVPVGGGGYSLSLDTAANMNSSFPTQRGWAVDMNNGSSTDTTAIARVVCSKRPTGYHQVSGTPATINPQTQASANVACPTNTVVLGGGGYISTGSVLADLNTMFPGGGGWTAYENNNNSVSNTLTSYVVCARDLNG